MNDSLIYPCLVHLMKIIHSKETNSQIKQFYHAHLIIKHFVEGKQMFNQKLQVYKNFLIYYQKKWVLNEDNKNLDPENSIYLKELHELNQKDKMVYQIVVRVLILGIQARMSIQINKKQVKQIINICEQLHMNLIFQGISISSILLQYIEKITIQIKNLVFYQSLLKIFVKLDYYQIIKFLQGIIAKFRQEWNKSQQQIQINVTKKNNRQSIFLPSVKRNLSLEGKQKQKKQQNDQINQNIKSVHKSQKQVIQTNYKVIRTAPKVHQSSRRRTFCKGNGYTFNSRGSTSDFFSSTQSISFEGSRIQENGNFNMLKSQCSSKMFYNYSQSNVKIMQNEENDVLADNTPKKNKIVSRC